MEENLFGAVAPKPPGDVFLGEDGEGGLAWKIRGKDVPAKTATFEPAMT